MVMDVLCSHPCGSRRMVGYQSDFRNGLNNLRKIYLISPQFCWYCLKICKVQLVERRSGLSVASGVSRGGQLDV